MKKYTKNEIEAAHARWIADSRLKPDEFMSRKDLAEQNVDIAAELITDCLIRYIEECDE